MIRTAFSTVACPSWTLSRVLESASEWGYDGVELRSFVGGAMPGRAGGTGFASEPMLTSGEKIRSITSREGVNISSLATGLRFDAPVFPPVIGHSLPTQHKCTAAGRAAVDLAAESGAESVRVFAYETPRGSSRRLTTRRIAERLRAVCDHARHKDVLVCLENGGAFRSAQQLAEVITLVDSPLLRASYDVMVGAEEGDTAQNVITTLGQRLHTLRLRDRSGESVAPLGEGEVPNAEFVRAASDAGLRCWAVVNWDVQWVEGLAPAEQVLPEAVKRVYGWLGASQRSSEGAAA